MGGIYPAVPTTAEIDVVKLHAFMKDPTKVNRLVNDEAADTFVSDWLFPNTIETNGAVLYEVADGTYLSRDPEEVAPGAVYPRAKVTEGETAFARVPKVGIDVPVTDEKIAESNRDEVKRAAQQVGRHVRRQIDTPALVSASAAITDTVASTGDWWLDIMTAVAQINEESEDYNADSVLVPWSLYPEVAHDLIPILPKEQRDGVVQTGKLPTIAGITIAPAILPAGATDPLVIDRQSFGRRAFKRIPSPEYTGDPRNGIETWSRRDPVANDQWLIRGRRPMIVIVHEPRAGRRITGA
jgi:FAD/FMN-containing dehydrogenase